MTRIVRLEDSNARLHAIERTVTVVFALLLLPPTFEALFSMGPLLPRETTALTIVSFMLALLSGVVAMLPPRLDRLLWLFAAPLAVLASVELSARGIVNAFYPRLVPELRALGLRTYPDKTVFIGHPFLLFTGNPERGYSHLGFPGWEAAPEKPSGEIRIALLGNSTTSDGYPEALQRKLQSAVSAAPNPPRFQALTFGMTGYTSVQSVINLVLNVQDYSPDYLIIHDGYGDLVPRGDRPEFRADYSHAFHEFSDPVSYDRYLRRWSIVYRAAKERWAPLPDWELLHQSTFRNIDWRPPKKDLSDLKPFARNIRTMIDFGMLRGMRIVLLTVPYSTDTANQWALVSIPHFEQVNALLRAIAAEYGDKIIFVDLDKVMTGKYNGFFLDVAHFKHEGAELKANLIAKAILADRARKAP